jgi:proline-specific peptidase
VIEHPEGTYRTVRGHRLWTETEGEGPLLVLLAGLGPAGSHLVFHPTFSALADGYRVMYVDLHGRGRSDHPDDPREITFAGDVADVAALLEQVGPAHLYGFSYGGLITQALALDHPELVRSVVLANTLHSPWMWQLNHENINREIANQFPEVWERIEALHAAGVPSTDPAMRAEFAVHGRIVRFFDPDKAALLLDEPGARNLELYPVFCGADVDFVVGGQIPSIPDFRPRLHEITVPMLVVAGRHDRALYPKLQREFAASAPEAEFLVLERSGSFGHLEEPETLFAAVRAFLENS